MKKNVWVFMGIFVMISLASAGIIAANLKQDATIEITDVQVSDSNIMNLTFEVGGESGSCSKYERDGEFDERDIKECIQSVRENVTDGKGEVIGTQQKYIGDAINIKDDQNRKWRYVDNNGTKHYSFSDEKLDELVEAFNLSAEVAMEI